MKRVHLLVFAVVITITIFTISYFSRTGSYQKLSPNENRGASLLEMYKILKTWNGSRPETNIIILTYMRSGSTLTGSLFEHQPDVFYVFEPLHSMKWIWWTPALYLTFLNESNRYVINLDDFKKEAMNIANGFLQCRFVDIDISTLTDRTHVHSEDTHPYQRCLTDGGGVLSLLKCLDVLYRKCSNSSVSVLKTIQFPMSAVEAMMTSNPFLKVIHLIRDPRPTIRSQILVGKSKWSDLLKYSADHCDRVNKDLEATQRIMMKYPGRIKILLYEDLAMNPMEHVKELYSFAGIDYDYEETEQFVKSLTQAKEEEIRSYPLKNINTSKHVFQWRHQMSYPDALTIDMNCMSVYTKLGFVPVQHEHHLKDLSRNLITEGTMSSVHKGNSKSVRVVG